jgi:undecaprenyl-diphosphatase
MIEAFILGMVQGLAEFLPISSSGHLIIVPWLFGFHDPGLGFDVALHWGTLVAVVAYFRHDVISIIRGFWHSLFKSTRDLHNNIYQKLSWLLIIASIPGAIFGKLLEDAAANSFRNPLLVAGALAAMGIILYIVDSLASKSKNLNHITWKDSLLVGLSQALALIPGVSRSGATMTAGLGLGFTRGDAARFSFLMIIPISLGAGLLKLPEFTEGVTIPELIVGFSSSVVFGFLAVKYLLRYITKHDYKIFVWYRLGLAALILIVYMIRG